MKILNNFSTTVLLIFMTIICFSCKKYPWKEFEEIPSWQCGDMLPVFDPATETFQIYKTVKIGGQCWMAENLNVGKKINISINDCSNQENNSIIEKYCWENQEANCDLFGGLYVWLEVMDYNDPEESIQGICPENWHIPTDQDWQELEKQLGMSAEDADSFTFGGDPRGTDEGSKLKDWTECLPSEFYCDTSEFNALMTGKVGCDALSNYVSFFFQKERTAFWTSTLDSDNNEPIIRQLNKYNTEIEKIHSGRDRGGHSCRCIRDKF